MSRTTISMSIGLAAYLVTTTALADTDAHYPTQNNEPQTEQPDSPPAMFADFEYLQRGKLHFDFGSVDYRLARDGVNLSYRIGGAATRALIGFSGDSHLEFGWQLRDASLKVAFSQDDNTSRYRIELARNF